jgi:hypothetical protein
MKTEHTKGEWKIKYLIEGNILPAYIYCKDKMICDMTGNTQTLPGNEANAKLIAAAPDMLDILIRIEKNGVGNITMKEIKEVIKKASA